MAILTKSPMGLLTSLLSLSSIFSLINASPSSLTPAAMLAAPRRSTALPNSAGTLALYTTSTYNFTTHAHTYGTWVLDLESGEETLFSNSSAIGEVHWLGDDNTILWTVGEDDGSTSLLVGDATTPNATPIPAGSLPGSISGIKITDLNGTFALVFSGSAAPNGTLYNSALAVEPLSSGRMYTQLFVRHWDTYLTPIRNSIWYTTLTSNGTASYVLSDAINALNGTGFETPIPPFGGTDDYDISPYGIVFIAKDITLNQATTTKSDVYFLPLTTFTEPAPKPQPVLTPGILGASDGAVFSPTGPSVIFVRQKGISYESDKNRAFLVEDITQNTTATEYYPSADGLGAWDRSPSTLFWSQDGKDIFAIVEDFARVRLFSFPASQTAAESLPKLIFKEGGVSDVQWLGTSKLLVSSTSFLDNSLFYSVDPSSSIASNATTGISLISANLASSTTSGLSRSQISEFYYKGEGDYQVHAWIIKPSFFIENETYPLAFYVHGGPQGATEDTWSTRWNMLVFAEQGYIVVAFNPTGSTGFGQNLTDGIQNQWGGRPYNDLVLGWEYIEENLSYVNCSRAIALGASYGGYMINWIQGNDLGRKFKALFTHDGVFSTLSQYSSEELWFMQHDFNGTLWDNWDNYARWNPANHTDQWSTPHLIVHNELDYRLPIAEGLAAFNVLQVRGVESKFLSFADEDHWVLRPENNLVWHHAVLNWLGDRVGLERLGGVGEDVYEATLMNGPLL